tara:strand:- start:117 stop:557 length:441 start_codon:yes stop_codon:yes gene_type:complete
MKKIFLLQVVFSVLVLGQNAKNLYLFSDEYNPKYLGCLTCSKRSPESICNYSGEFGSLTGLYSIWNSAGLYGSEVGLSSPWSEVSISPPKIFNSQGIFTSSFTINNLNIDKDNAVTSLLRKYYFKHRGNLKYVREDWCSFIEYNFK